MASAGYAGGILYVNLSDGSIKKEPLDKDTATRFIGGMGVNSKLAYDLIPPGTDPFSPQNAVIYGAGPFVGTLVPASGRVDISGRSPLTGLLGMANGGNSIGAMLKYAGYDHLVISGRAEKPVYLKVFDDEIEVCDARDLWGKDVWEASDQLWEELGECWVSCIGRGGEKLVRFACVIDNKRAAYSRTGLGAVLGSKNLKAIAVRGSKGIEVADPKGFMELVDGLLERIAASPLVEMWRTLGFTMAFDGYSKAGLFLTKNFTRGCLEISDALSQKEYCERVVKAPYACLACPIGCKQQVELKGGNYSGLSFKISSLGAQAGYHSSPGVDSWDEIVKCVELENRYGLDSTSACAAIATAIELFERGIISGEETQGLELNWNADTVKTLLGKIANREGLGDLLAEGALRASQRFGKEAEKYAFHIKGLDTPLGLRGRLSTENFGQLTNPRGGHLDRSPSITFAPRKPEAFRRYCPSIGVPEEAMARVCQGPEGFNVPRLTKWVEDYNSITTSLGLCHRTPVSQHYSLELLTRLYVAATGIKVSPAELRQAGERVWNIQRAFNLREGAGRDDDRPPTRAMTEPVMIGEHELPPFSIERVKAMMDEYYEERGWDLASGAPSRQKLEELGLEDIAPNLLGENNEH